MYTPWKVYVLQGPRLKRSTAARASRSTRRRRAARTRSSNLRLKLQQHEYDSAIDSQATFEVLFDELLKGARVKHLSVDGKTVSLSDEYSTRLKPEAAPF